MSSRRTRGTRAEVVSAVFISAGRHHPQFMRPFEINSTDESIEDMLDNLGNLKFETDSLGGWSAGLIGASAQVSEDDEALIPFGWDAERLRFFIHAQIPDRMGTNDTQDFYITGFTENDTTYELEGGDIQMEDDTRMFINSITRIRRTSGADLKDLLGGSSDDRLSIETNSHCLIAYTDNDQHGRNHNDVRSLRPYDIASRLDNDDEEYQMDSRSDFSTGLTKSSQRDNTSAGSYLGRTIEALYESNRESITSQSWRSTSNKNPYVNAQRMLREGDQNRCKIMRMLRSETSFLRNGYITYEEACNVFDGLDNEAYTSVMVEEEVTRSRGHGRTSDMSGEGLGGSDMETVASYQALNSISGIMMESCIIQAHFLASTNRRGKIQFSFQRDTAPVFFIRDMTEEQQEENIFLLERRLRQFVFDPLEFKVGEFEMDANMDAMGDSQFFLSIQGDKEAEFWGATFADGSTSSQLTTRRGAQSELASDSKRLVDSLITR